MPSSRAIHPVQPSLQRVPSQRQTERHRRFEWPVRRRRPGRGRVHENRSRFKGMKTALVAINTGSFRYQTRSKKVEQEASLLPFASPTAFPFSPLPTLPLQQRASANQSWMSRRSRLCRPRAQTAMPGLPLLFLLREQLYARLVRAARAAVIAFTCADCFTRPGADRAAARQLAASKTEANPMGQKYPSAPVLLGHIAIDSRAKRSLGACLKSACGRAAD